MNIEKIFLNQQFQNQKEVFQFLGTEMKMLAVVSDEKKFISAVEERESQSTTGLVNGFAIPHGKSSSIEKAMVIYIRNEQGIEWNSLDGSLVTDIFALAIPEAASEEHLNTLISISTNLMDDSVCERLRKTNSEDEIRAIFE